MSQMKVLRCYVGEATRVWPVDRECFHREGMTQRQNWGYWSGMECGRTIRGQGEKPWCMTVTIPVGQVEDSKTILYFSDVDWLACVSRTRAFPHVLSHHHREMPRL